MKKKVVSCVHKLKKNYKLKKDNKNQAFLSFILKSLENSGGEYYLCMLKFSRSV